MGHTEAAQRLAAAAEQDANEAADTGDKGLIRAGAASAYALLAIAESVRERNAASGTREGRP